MRTLDAYGQLAVWYDAMYIAMGQKPGVCEPALADSVVELLCDVPGTYHLLSHRSMVAVLKHDGRLPVDTPDWTGDMRWDGRGDAKFRGSLNPGDRVEPTCYPTVLPGYTRMA